MENETYTYAYATQGSAQRGQPVPFNIVYEFTRLLEGVTEQMLPFLKPILVTNDSSNTAVQNINYFYRYQYGNNYFEFYGDTDLIYRGTESPTQRSFSYDDENYEINPDFTSTWFRGTLEWVSSGNNRRLTNSSLVQCYSSWGSQTFSINFGTESVPDWQDVTVSTNSFASIALDNITSTEFTGTGTYSHSPYVEDKTIKYQVIKNHTMTAPLFQNTTQFLASGNYFQNNVYITTYSIDFPVALNFPPGVCTSLTYEDSGGRKLFYSNKRAREFRYNHSTRLLTNLPTQYYYQTNTLPYTNLFSKQNVGDWPKKELARSPSIYKSNQNFMFIKVNENKFALRLSGNLLGEMPAYKQITGTRTFQDETYIISGSTYVLSSQNRSPKEIVSYQPDVSQSNLKLKLLISYINPLSESQASIIKS